MQKVLGNLRKAVNAYNMINEGDKICVAVSGGKDSLALLVSLARLKSIMNDKISLVAVTIDNKINGIEGDFSSVSNLCEQLNIPYHIEKTDTFEIVFNIRNEKNPCSLCAKIRRGALCNVAIKYGCNKLALGHNMDDVLQTFIMNLKNGSLSIFSPITSLSDTEITVIRPLIFTPEKDIVNAIKKNNISIVENNCPMNKHSEREKIKNFINKLEYENHGLKEKILGAIIRSHLSNW